MRATNIMSATETISVPKRITNAQTVCNEKNEKGKPCWGHLKQLRTAGEPAEIHLRGDDVLFQCQACGTLYMGPPLGHVRDPYKQSRFVEAELQALLQAAGGTHGLAVCAERQEPADNSQEPFHQEPFHSVATGPSLRDSSIRIFSRRSRAAVTADSMAIQ